MNGFTLHVFWHIFSCLGAYLGFLHLICVRIQFLGGEPQIGFVFGVVPVVKYLAQNKQMR
jgi:hypothetical protein